MLLRVLAAALLVATPAFAVTVTSSPGAPDPGLAPGQTLLVSFDAPNVAGVTDASSGRVITASGSTSGVRAAPAGTGNGVYRSIGAGGQSVFDFSGWSNGNPLANLSFYWGSVDSYNFVDFLDAAGTRIGGISGNDLPSATGNQSIAATNRRVFFDFLPSENVTAVRLRSTGAAFEFDSIGATALESGSIASGAVPEPASWVMLIAGFGAIGLAMRRRDRTAAA